jgi:hypothetical protein
MFLSLNDVNSCLPVSLAGDLDFPSHLAIRRSNPARAGLDDLVFFSVIGGA